MSRTTRPTVASGQVDRKLTGKFTATNVPLRVRPISRALEALANLLYQLAELVEEKALASRLA
jgi:hypothetical protein